MLLITGLSTKLVYKLSAFRRTKGTCSSFSGGSVGRILSLSIRAYSALITQQRFGESSSLENKQTHCLDCH